MKNKTCISPLATRPVLYTDTVGGKQTCRDDLWAVSTDELNALHRQAAPEAPTRKAQFLTHLQQTADMVATWPTWKQTMYAPAPATQQAGAAVICQSCQGSGEGKMLVGGGPDAYEIDSNCSDCGGIGEIPTSPAATTATTASASECQWCDGSGRYCGVFCDPCGGTGRAPAPSQEVAPLTRCAAGRDGDCNHPQCPQARDGEPHKSQRHCPLDTLEDGE